LIFGKGSRDGFRWGGLLPFVLMKKCDFWQRQQIWLQVGRSVAFCVDEKMNPRTKGSKKLKKSKN